MTLSPLRDSINRVRTMGHIVSFIRVVQNCTKFSSSSFLKGSVRMNFKRIRMESIWEELVPIGRQ